jgi:hypothetical protein
MSIGGHITLKQGDTAAVLLTLTDSDGDPFDLTSDVVRLIIYKNGTEVLYRSSTVPAEITIRTPPTLGLADVFFSSAEIATLENGAYTYQVFVDVSGVTPEIAIAPSPLLVCGPNAIVWGEVAAIAPTLANTNPYTQGAILEYVNTALHVECWGGEGSPQLRLARLYMAAHMGTVSSSGASGAAGPVTSETAGGLTRSYGFMSSTEADPLLDATPYGRMYRELLMRSAARSPIVL